MGTLSQGNESWPLGPATTSSRQSRGASLSRKIIGVFFSNLLQKTTVTLRIPPPMSGLGGVAVRLAVTQVLYIHIANEASNGSRDAKHRKTEFLRVTVCSLLEVAE